MDIRSRGPRLIGRDAAGRRSRRPRTARPAPRGEETASVLLVEDNPVNADMLSRRLARRGFVVALADDGLVATEIAARDQPDLILMDISLPGLDGLEATRRLKAHPATAAIPVIILTAHATVEDRQRSFAAGCQDFETKPVDFERLVAKVRACLGVLASV
jgi:CheY-like chemotaxis protein